MGLRSPDFLIVGAAKCGTTSLAAALRDHPDVFMPTLKELSYFAQGDGQRVQTFDEYSAYFRDSGDAKVVGEASVAYLWSSSAAGMIAEQLGGQTKIIVMLRAPWKMAYSLWGHQCRLERESLAFEAALDAEEARRNGEMDLVGWRDNFFYSARASYANQVRRYIDVFGAEQVKVLVSEDVFKSPTEPYADLCNWLGIQSMVLDRFPRSNVAGKSRIPGLRRWMDGSSFGKRLVRKILPGSIRSGGRKAVDRVNRKDVALDRMSSRTEEHLRSVFRRDVEELSALVDRDLVSSWYA
ncbi:MAG: sulfotransferase domain-containing protein [Phycisphaerales bacterium]|nr:sulfotransferase domain-containing protein [Phycisphaerales bacterium]